VVDEFHLSSTLTLRVKRSPRRQGVIYRVSGKAGGTPSANLGTFQDGNRKVAQKTNIQMQKRHFHFMMSRFL
jgi:hypothetical protein